MSEVIELVHEMDVETYVRCENAAKATGKKSVEEYVSFLIAEKVGHTSFLQKRVGHT